MPSFTSTDHDLPPSVVRSNPPEYVFRSRVDTKAVCESRNQPPYSLYGNVRGVTSLQVFPPSVVRSSKYRPSTPFDHAQPLVASSIRISAIDRPASDAIVGADAGAGKVAVRQLVASARLKNASTDRNSTLLTGNCLFTDDRNMGAQWAGVKFH